MNPEFDVSKINSDMTVLYERELTTKTKRIYERKKRSMKAKIKHEWKTYLITVEEAWDAFITHPGSE